jgi:alpha-L-fucosidase 2
VGEWVREGLKARGGVAVNICWKEGGLHEVGLWLKNHNSFRGAVVKTNLSPVECRVYTFNKQLRCRKTYILYHQQLLLESRDECL